MKRRILAILLIATMLLSAIPVNAADVTDAPTFVVDQVTAAAGETVDVKISVENNPGVTSIKLKVAYDAENLVLNSVEFNTDEMGGKAQRVNLAKNPATLNWYEGEFDVYGDWVFATLNFTVAETAAPGEYPVTITYNPDDVFNLEENNVEFAIIDGSITVECLHTNKLEVPAKSPDCTNPGNNLYYICDCGVVLKADGVTETTEEDEVIPAKGHEYQAVVTAPTCTEAGYTTYTCACGDSYVTDEVAAKGHEYQAVVTAPTCTEAGYTTYTCACGDSYVADEVAALGHEYQAVVTAPTCTEGGYTTYTCACGDSYVADKVPAKGHSYEEVVTAPACTEAGYTTYTCACGDSYVADEVAALGHSFTNYVSNNDATCTEDGTKTAKCDNCDVVNTIADAGSAKGHDHEAVVIAPTCTEAGYTTYTCACGDTYVADKVAALGHSFTNYVSNDDATCTEDGTKTAKCDRCDETDTVADEGTAKGHNYQAVVTAPTCTEAGYTTYTCACGDSYVADEVAALGHDYAEEWSVGEEGHWHECAVCHDKADFAEHDFGTEGDVCLICAYERDHVHRLTLVPAVEATCTSEGSKAYYTCSGCENWFEDAAGTILIKDKTSVKTEMAEHAYEETVVDATCTEDGSITYTCADCGDTYTETIPAEGHKYEEGVCTECGAEDPDYEEEESSSLRDWLKDWLKHWWGNQDDEETECEHSYVDEVKAPTCTEKGYTKHTCEKCGDCYTDRYVVATGHNYENNVCTECGHKKPGWFFWFDWFWKK